MQPYGGIKRNELWTHNTDESQSQIQKSPYCRITVMGHSGEGQAVPTNEGSVVATGWDWGQGLTGEGH